MRLPGGSVDDDGGRTDWNQEKSLVTNYERNGLVSNANGFYFAGGRNALQNTETTTSDEKDETAKTRTRRVATENALTKNSDRDELRKAVGVASSTGVARPKRLTPRQRRLCEAMTNKHGKDNVEKMFRDIKLNTMQKTKGELRQMLESYEYYKEENEATDGRIRVDFRAPTKRPKERSKKKGKKVANERYSPRADMEQFFSKAPSSAMDGFEGLSVIGMGGRAR